MTLTRLKPAGHIALLVVVLVVGLAGGATAKATFDANNARNADKVDGRHAVGASASTHARKGRLVATNPNSGRLPDNIIGRAPDSARLGGVPAPALKRLTFPVTSAGVGGTGATVFVDEVDLSGSQDGTVSWTVLLPADRVAGDPIRAQLLYQEGSDPACSWFAATGGIVESDDGFANSAWIVPGAGAFSGPITLPAGPRDAHRATFVFAASDRGPGQLVSFTVSRQPGNVADTCQTVRIRGVQVLY
jgi:hypothetical protein